MLRLFPSSGEPASPEQGIVSKLKKEVKQLEGVRMSANYDDKGHSLGVTLYGQSSDSEMLSLAATITSVLQTLDLEKIGEVEPSYSSGRKTILLTYSLEGNLGAALGVIWWRRGLRSIGGCSGPEDPHRYI